MVRSLKDRPLSATRSFGYKDRGKKKTISEKTSGKKKSEKGYDGVRRYSLQRGFSSHRLRPWTGLGESTMKEGLTGKRPMLVDCDEGKKKKHTARTRKKTPNRII